MNRQNPGSQILNKLYDKRKRDNKITPTLSKDIPRLPIGNTQEFNRLIGWPKHPKTLERNPILDYQLKYILSIYQKHRVILNKSRKIGATETALRAICENCYGPYMGHNVVIVAGNRQDEANIILERFDDLFIDGWTDMNGKKWIYGDLVMNKKSDRLQLYSNVDIRTIPANPRALRAQANTKCVFFTEAAHINSLNDSKVWAAVRPIVANDDSADIIVESTPNGIRGFFHDEFHNQKNGYVKLEYDYKYALGKLITQEFIDNERQSNVPWIFEQEYMCKFVASGSGAIDIDKIKYTDHKLIDLDEILNR